MSKSLTNTERKLKSWKTSDVLEINDKNLIGGDGELREMVEAATLNAQVASSIYEARKAAELTQAELAELVGTRQSVISQLEDSDYEGHSLSMLRRVAHAMHRCVELRLIPEETEASHG